MIRVLRIVLALSLLFVANVARAAAFEVRAHADPEVVEVGDAVRFVLEASSESDVPSDPKLGAASGFQVTGPSTSSTQSMSIVNGVVSQKRGISATWLLRATREGTFNVGPANVRINGEKRAAAPVQVRVVGKGKAPKRRPDFGLGGMPDPFGQMPFDPFGGGPDPLKGFFDDFRKGPAENVVTADPKLTLDAPRGQGAFLHATVDRSSAVVGEQVTYSVLLYIDINEGDSSLRDGHEAPAADFLRKPLADVNKQNVVGYALIQGRPWLVRQIRKTALFPIKTGTLEIGRMSLMLASGRSPGLRETESLKVNVGEPPVKGRPHGYSVGDVGQFALSADVSPREVENGGAIAVVIDLKGTGNLPAQLNVPSSDRAEWLEPTVSEKVGPTANSDRFGGSRTFTYVVRAKQEGNLDLGELRLPFWNPDSRSYGIARAPLGNVMVKPGVGVAAAQTKEVELLPGLPAPLGPTVSVAKIALPYSDSPLFWGAWMMPPSLLLAATSASALGARLRERRKRESASPSRELAEKRTLLVETARTGDSRNIVGATARFLEQAVLVYAGLNLRGLVADERQDALESAAIFSEDAARFCELFDACERHRFSPEAPDLGTVREAADHALVLVDRIAKTAKPHRPQKAPGGSR